MTIADLALIAGRTYPARRRTQNLVGGASPIQAANFSIGAVTLEPNGGQVPWHNQEQEEVYFIIEGMGEWFAAAWFHFERGDGEGARRRIKELLQQRSGAQPLALPNAGSVFRNPPGDHAARLIEACGLKGYAIGGARVSEKHANFIVNARGRGSAADIETLIEHVRHTVLAQQGVDLMPEVRVIGERLA
jgi:UDP-N-acetylenolpyruvoylglucosamine reductase